MYWLAAVLELKLEMSKALGCLQYQTIAGDALKASQMNRLQLSMNGSQLPNNAKVSTAQVSTFLKNTLKILEAYLQQNVEVQENWVVSSEIYVPSTANFLSSYTKRHYVPCFSIGGTLTTSLQMVTSKKQLSKPICQLAMIYFPQLYIIIKPHILKLSFQA